MSKKPAHLTSEQVSEAFRALSEEHIAERRRDDPEAIWRRIERRLEPARLRVVPPVRFRWPARLGTAVAVAALCAGALAFWRARTAAPPSEPPLTFVVEGTDTARSDTPRVDERLIATEERSATIALSDRSRIELQPHTTLRVHVEGGEKVITRLAQGELLVHVEHRPQTDYRFRAGPYEVRVIGTAFSLRYDPEGKRLALAMSEGRVTVADETGRLRVVEAGQSLNLPESAPQAALSEAPSEGAPLAATSKGVPASSAAPKSARSSYRSLAAEGRFQEIVAVARAEGLEQVLDRKPASELQELAQAARYTGELALAAKTWREMQARFPGKEAGQNAGFFLGRLAEQQGRSSEALRYYEAYLSAQARGVFAPEALGRKMQLVQVTQGAPAARAVAAEYLARFPSGPYAQAARALTSK